MWFTVLSLTGFFVTLIATSAVKKYALRHNIVDDPSGKPRKIHSQPIPLLGGMAIYIGFAATIIVAFYFGILPSGSILSKHLIGLLLGGLWLVIGGFLDDKYNLAPKKQLIWPVMAVITVIAAGIGIESISNPWGGQWFLDQIDIVIFNLGEVPYKITLLADLFTFIWLFAVIYATKFFDGLDGLVSGITIIGSFVVYFTSLIPKINQPETALVALIVASCFAGFLVCNFHPARIFLGESGSTLAGFLIGSLAIISESKVVTTLVVMALPILDLIWVVARRMFIERKSPVLADKKHIHHRLLAVGFTHRQAVLILYAWALVLGIVAWLYQGTEQYIVLLAAIAAIMAFAVYLVRKAKQV